jgi:hypothetical protein
MSKNIIVYLFVWWASSVVVLAQNTNLPGESVEYESAFKARLIDTERIALSPQLPPVDTAVKPQTYQIVNRSIPVDYPAPQIRPVAMKAEKLPEQFGGYARLGGGTPASLYGDLSWHTAKDKKYTLGLGVLHHSANNSNKIENQKFAYTTAGAEGAVFLDQGIGVSAKARYTSDDVFFYGYNLLNRPDSLLPLSFAPDDVKQRFSVIDIGAQIFNSERTKADFNYSAGFDAYFLNDAFAARENGFDLKINATKWLEGGHAFRVLLRTDFTNYKDTVAQSLHNFYLNPNFTYVSDLFRIKAGLNLVSHQEKISIFPDIEVSAQLIGPSLNAFVGAEGTLQKNTFRSLSDYNPFISSRNQIQNTRYLNYFGGARGVVQGVDYRIQVGYKTTDNLATFLGNGDTIPRFNVLYDTVNIAYFHAAVSAPVFKGLSINAFINQNFFSAGNGEKAWHLPAFTFSAGAAYATSNGKASVRADLFLENGVPYLDALQEVQFLNALFDLSLSGNYQISKNFGAFLQLNNLADNRRQRWQYYPVFGLNAVAGITARF